MSTFDDYLFIGIAVLLIVVSIARALRDIIRARRRLKLEKNLISSEMEQVVRT